MLYGAFLFACYVPPVLGFLLLLLVFAARQIPRVKVGDDIGRLGL